MGDATFSQSECQLLSLARAFVGNFEFMIIPKPCQLLSPESIRRVCKTLLEFVDRRGVGMSEDGMHLREIRTCLVSGAGNELTLASVCHRVYSIGKAGIRVVDTN